ncbi:MAG: PHP domain-containing protein [Firmicutes bacterium]|nr:PHP domain-containing protein [Bacillota bacterium]
MKNSEVAEMLARTATLLALRGEDRYRVRAYRSAARAVASLEEDVATLAAQNRLQSIDGVGAGIGAKIKEILQTGSLAMLERLETNPPPEDDEERRYLLASALTFHRQFLPRLQSLPGVACAAITGDVRRRKETVACLEYVLGTTDAGAAQKAVAELPQLHRLRWRGDCCQAVHSYGICLRFHFTAVEDFVRLLWLTTGTEEHVRHVAVRIKARSGRDLYKTFSGAGIAAEEELYNLAGLPYIAPELREDRGEIAAAAAGKLPRLVEASAYKGDLHVHTSWSDGTAGIEEMAAAARELGYEYLAITDHSRSLTVAKGLSLERLAAQKAHIESLQNKYGIRILTGIEADILDDGTVDAPDEILAVLDIVIASVHTGLKQEREKITSRIIRAMQNPYVQIIGHATGRLLGKREESDVDMDAILREAAKTGTVLEINASPDRLDITDTIALQAKNAGIKMAVNTDAHSQMELANMLLGLAVARRGWLEDCDVINTLGADALLEILHQKRTGF